MLGFVLSIGIMASASGELSFCFPSLLPYPDKLWGGAGHIRFPGGGSGDVLSLEDGGGGRGGFPSGA